MSDLKKGETQIVYFNGEERKIAVGKIIEETEEYIKLERPQGIHTIYKRCISDRFEGPKDGN